MGNRAFTPAQQALEKYKSHRNRVGLVQTDGGRFVVKTFREEEDFRKELEIYRLLQNTDISCAKVIRAEGKTLVLSQLPGKNLVECLEEQEKSGIPTWDIWEKLVAWLILFQRYTGLVMTDVNLRNFLYDEKTNMLWGVDFEECDAGSIGLCAARVAAFIRTYKPEHTPLKQEISQYVLERFARCCSLESDALSRESGRQEAMLLERRKKQ